ncbi:cyclic nucleotide-gated channel rod photoreceptor subunit alpha-like isoform X2 [Bolinopsis microptera]|uniref:cyclic nucleotide-gated channel rod photoreceptor subunit alpha-like isoform X2 n=1 Tax=Bolinopsis microptera TaxID=2820187 RepID=UPI00307939D6
MTRITRYVADLFTAFSWSSILGPSPAFNPNALAKDHIPEDEDPFILQHFNDRTKKKVYVGSNKPGGTGEEQGAFVVDPAGDLYFFTQALVTIAMLYNLVSSVLRLTFREFEEQNQFVIFTLDSICDIIYLSDFAVKFRRGYLDDGILVTDVQKIKENYMSSQDFSWDLAAVLPLCISYGVAMEIYQHSSYLFTSRPDVEASMIKNILIGEATLRLFKLAKFYSMRRFFESFGSRTNSPGVMRAFCLIMYLLLSIHWVACIYYCVSEYEGFGRNSWVFPKYEPDDPNSNLHRKYIHCFYWAFLTLTTIGGPDQPDTTLEFILTCITFLLGIFIFAAVVGNVGDAITSMNESKTTNQKRSDAIKLYMQHHGVPDILQRKVKKWLEYSWMRTQGADEQSLMDALPERLRARIAIQIHVKTLKKVKIFENCEHGLLCELVLKLKPQIYSPGDYICRIGEIGKEMFIISHGKVECIITTGTGERKTVAVLVAGQSFGEIALLGVEGCSRRTADVRAIGYSELLSLSKKALTQALEDYPEARKQLEQEGKNRLGKGSSSNSNNVKEELEDQVATSPQISALISQLKNFDSMMCKEKLAALTAEKEALKQELKTKTEELEEAQRLILEYTDNRTRLK